MVSPVHGRQRLVLRDAVEEVEANRRRERHVRVRRRHGLERVCEHRVAVGRHGKYDIRVEQGVHK
eukprot:3052038-Prymnesium_polylepis.3